MVLGLVRNATSADFPNGNCKIACDRLISKYASHTASSLLKLKSGFHNFGGLQIQMSKFRLKVIISDEDFIVHILNNLPKEYDVILDGLKNRLTVSGNDVFIIDIICKKLNHHYKKIKKKKNQKRKDLISL